MLLEEAIAIVLDLARENVLEGRQILDDEMAADQQAQFEALDLVATYLDRKIKES